LKRALSITVLAITLCCLSTSSSNPSVARYATIDKDHVEKNHVIILQEVYIKPGDSSTRYFGDLKVTLKLSKSGTAVNCNMYLSTQLLGVETITPNQNVYQFDLQLANTTAKGQLTLFLNKGPYTLSKVSGNFTYSVVSNHESYTYKGDLIAWHLDE
jgi:hypothetical protein